MENVYGHNIFFLRRKTITRRHKTKLKDVKARVKNEKGKTGEREKQDLRMRRAKPEK